MKPKYERPMLVDLVSASDEAAGYCDRGSLTNQNGCVSGGIIGYAACHYGNDTWWGACANGHRTRGGYCSIGDAGRNWDNCQTGGTH